MKQETATVEFHDSKSEDIYDLFNACNGVLHNGLLDVRKLQEYTPEESQALNVVRLREIWAHTASGCPHCEEIVIALNDLRVVLKESSTSGGAEAACDSDPSYF